MQKCSAARIFVIFILIIGIGSLVARKNKGRKNQKPLCHFIPNVTEPLYSNEELRNLSEVILEADYPYLSDYIISFNPQNHSSNLRDDNAPECLLTIDKRISKIPTVKLLYDLFDNYIQTTAEREIVTQEEKEENDAFLKTVLKRPVMQIVINSFIEKGIFRNTAEVESALKEIWFEQYARRNKGTVLSSSGFEHVFLSEIRGDKILGFHNWLYFNELEEEGKANYLGYVAMKNIGHNKTVIDFSTTLNDKFKPSTGFFVGTSPEFEFAIYSLCFIARPERMCKLKFGGQKVGIQTYNIQANGKCMLATAYPNV